MPDERNPEVVLRLNLQKADGKKNRGAIKHLRPQEVGGRGTDIGILSKLEVHAIKIREKNRSDEKSIASVNDLHEE